LLCTLIIKTFISFAFLASVSTVSANSAFEKGVVEKTYTPAQVIENKNESFPKSYSGSRLEGWALLSYVVAKDGSVNDIEVISHSAVVDTQAEAQRYLNNLVFSPAIKGEQAVESGYLFTYQAGKYFTGYANDKASRGFISGYDDVNTLIKEKNFKEAELELAQLFTDHTKNTAEQALFAWLKSQFYYFQQQWQGFDEQVKVAYLLRAQLPTELHYTVVKSALQWFIYKQDFYLAYNAINSLGKIEGKVFTSENKLATTKQVDELLAQTTVINTEITLHDQQVDYISLSRANIVLENAQNLEQVELRCANQVVKFSPSKQIVYAVDPASRRCGLLLKSKKSEQLTLTQTGEIIVGLSDYK